MNNKGFTLVELLAVIIILSLLALLASTSVTKVVRDSKSDLYNSQIQLIKSAAEAWGADNLDKIPEGGQCKYLTLKQLKEYGLLDSNIKNPKTNQEFSDDMLIKITSEVSKYNTLNTTYEVDANDVEGCTEAIIPICTLAENGDVGEEGITPGDKYLCKVKDDMPEGYENGYTFYVLSQNNDGTTNLILDRNINSDGTLATEALTKATAKNGIYNLVEWVSKEDYNDDINYTINNGKYIYGNNNKGPITAMNFVYNATKDWTNVPNIQMDYEDEGNTGSYGYGKIVTTNGVTKITKKDGSAVTVLTNKEGYTNLKARIPKYGEVHGEGKCLTYSENGNKYGSCPLYLVNYLNNSSAVTGDGLQNISRIYGYWTLSSHANYLDYAMYVSFSGDVDYLDLPDSDSFYDYSNEGSGGIRPVINLKI